MTTRHDDEAPQVLARARASELLTLPQAAARVGMTNQKFLDVLHHGDGPRPILIEGDVRFISCVVDDWACERASKPRRVRQRALTQEDLEPTISDLLASLTKPDGGTGAPATTA